MLIIGALILITAPVWFPLVLWSGYVKRKKYAAEVVQEKAFHDSQRIVRERIAALQRDTEAKIFAQKTKHVLYGD